MIKSRTRERRRISVGGPSGQPAVGKQRRLVYGATNLLAGNAVIGPQLESLVAAGWDLHVVCAPGGVTAADMPAGVTLHNIEMTRSVSPVRDSLSLIRWVRLTRKLQPDVVVGATPKAAMLAMLAGKIAGIRIRVFYAMGARWDGSTGIWHRLVLTGDRVAAAASTNVVAVSQSLAELLISHGVSRPTPVVLGAGGSKGVDLRIFHPRDVESSDGDVVLGFLGRIASDKGIATLLDIFDHVQRQTPDVRLLVVGGVDEGQPVDPTVLSRFRDDPRIHWTGRVDTPANLLREMDILLFPSLREGLPNAVIEAEACGVPVVGWDVTGVRDSIREGETGFLVKYGQIEEFSARVVELVMDQDLRAKTGFAATAFARTSFDSRVVQGAFIQYLEDLYAHS